MQLASDRIAVFRATARGDWHCRCFLFLSKQRDQRRSGRPHTRWRRLQVSREILGAALCPGAAPHVMTVSFPRWRRQEVSCLPPPFWFPRTSLPRPAFPRRAASLLWGVNNLEKCGFSFLPYRAMSGLARFLHSGSPRSRADLAPVNEILVEILDWILT